MIKEYFFTEEPDKWDKYVDVYNDEVGDYLHFTDRNLKTTHSSEVKELKN
jgi:hypothetical protein